MYSVLYNKDSDAVSFITKQLLVLVISTINDRIIVVSLSLDRVFKNNVALFAY